MKRHLTRCGFILTGALLMSTTVAAQEASLQDKALAAGYKAMFTCSAVFNGGKTADQIAADELDNVYGDYVLAMKAVGTAEIDAVSKIVSVDFDKSSPPRLSVWREHLGCAALPQGAAKTAAKHLPRVKLNSKARDLSLIHI